MEPTEDTDLLWIAEEALTAGEPEGWTEQMDPNGNLYYYNGNYGFSPTPRPSKTRPSNAPPLLGFVFFFCSDDGPVLAPAPARRVLPEPLLEAQDAAYDGGGGNGGARGDQEHLDGSAHY